MAQLMSEYTHAVSPLILIQSQQQNNHLEVTLKPILKTSLVHQKLIKRIQIQIQIQIILIPPIQTPSITKYNHIISQII